MQKFDFDKFNVNGQKFHMVIARYTSKEGLTLEVRDQTVSRGQGTCAAVCEKGGRGFVTNSTSCTTFNFYEVNGYPKVNNIYMPNRCELYVYCLPENLEDVKHFIMNHLATACQDYHNDQLKDLAKIRVNLNSYFYSPILND